MAVVDLNKAPLSESGRLALLRLEKFAERLASRSDHIGVDSTESILMVVRELAASEARLRQRCAAAEVAVPTNWCDPLLTGPNAALGPHAGKWGCPDIERLLAGVRSRIKAAIDRAGGGERENGDG
jgi:hypothetical protein